MDLQQPNRDIPENFNFFSSITKIWPLITGQVTGILSASIFQTLTSFPNQTETGILTVLFGVFYILIDGNIRKIVSSTESYRNNDIWTSVVSDWLDAFYRFWIFLTIQYANFMVRNEMTGNDPSIFYQLIFIFSLVMILLLVVSVVEYLDEKMSKNQSSFGNLQRKASRYTLFGKNSATVFLSVYNGMYGVVVQFYTDFLFSQVRILPNSVEIGILSAFLVVLYLLIEHIIRGILKFTEGGSSLMWKYIQKILDFFVVFSIFFSIQYAGLLISSISDMNQFGTFARFISLFSIYILSYSLFGFLTFLYKEKEQKSDLDSGKSENSLWITAIGRIWPQISGTTTGLFANLIVSDVVTGSNQAQVLSLIITLLILWSIADPILRHILVVYGDENKLWRAIVQQLLDFPVALCPLLIYTVISNILDRQINSGQIGLFSQVIIIFSIQLVSICFFTTINQLSK